MLILCSDRDLVNLYNSGLSLDKLSSKVGIPRETLRLRLHRLHVKMRHVHPVFSRPRQAIDFDGAVLLGLHAGDGWISHSWGVSIHSTDTKMVAEVERLVREVLGVEPGVEFSNEHTTTVRSGKRQVIEFFTNHGFPVGRKAATVAIPPYVFTSAVKIKRGFLKGLFSADGCFYKEGLRGECRFEVASKKLRDGFVTLASHLEFEFKRYSYVHHGGHNRLPLHVAYLGKQTQVLRWMNEIGSICDNHIWKYKDLLKSLKRRRKSRKSF